MTVGSRGKTSVVRGVARTCPSTLASPRKNQHDTVATDRRAVGAGLVRAGGRRRPRRRGARVGVALSAEIAMPSLMAFRGPGAASQAQRRSSPIILLSGTGRDPTRDRRDATGGRGLSVRRRRHGLHHTTKTAKMKKVLLLWQHVAIMSTCLIFADLVV